MSVSQICSQLTVMDFGALWGWLLTSVLTNYQHLHHSLSSIIPWYLSLLLVDMCALYKNIWEYIGPYCLADVSTELQWMLEAYVSSLYSIPVSKYHMFVIYLTTCVWYKEIFQYQKILPIPIFLFSPRCRQFYLQRVRQIWRDQHLYEHSWNKKIKKIFSEGFGKRQFLFWLCL